MTLCVDSEQYSTISNTLRWNSRTCSGRTTLQWMLTDMHCKKMQIIPCGELDHLWEIQSLNLQEFLQMAAARTTLRVSSSAMTTTTMTNIIINTLLPKDLHEHMDH